MAGKTNARSHRRVGTTSLDSELSVYRKNLPMWLKKHEHTYVLIKGDVAVGFYETRIKHLPQVTSGFSVVPLFVKQVEASEPVYHIPNALL